MFVEALFLVCLRAEIDEDRFAIEADPEAAGVVVAVTLSVVGSDGGEIKSLCTVLFRARGHQSCLREPYIFKQWGCLRWFSAQSHLAEDGRQCARHIICRQVARGQGNHHGTADMLAVAEKQIAIQFLLGVSIARVQKKIVGYARFDDEFAHPPEYWLV